LSDDIIIKKALVNWGFFNVPASPIFAACKAKAYLKQFYGKDF